jgi:hypothetical protein
MADADHDIESAQIEPLHGSREEGEEVAIMPGHTRKALDERRVEREPFDRGGY